MSTYEKMNQMIDLSVLVYKRVIRLYFFLRKNISKQSWRMVGGQEVSKPFGFKCT